MLSAAAWIVLGYLLGSIPTGYWLGKALKGIDIRHVGSGSTGATNVLRSLGKGPALVVLVVDVAKGCIPVVLSANYEPSLGLPWSNWHLLAPVVALACMIGHSKSIFLQFQGGKSAATALGTLLALNWIVGLSVFALWILLVFTTRFVSIASMAAGCSSVILMFCLGNPLSYVVYCLAGASYVIYRHQSNVKRLLSGTEPRLGEKKSDSPSGECNVQP